MWKGFGLQAEEPMEKNDFLMEYVGEVLDVDMCAGHCLSVVRPPPSFFKTVPYLAVRSKGARPG